jgi:hypothetical protein
VKLSWFDAAGLAVAGKRAAKRMKEQPRRERDIDKFLGSPIEAKEVLRLGGEPSMCTFNFAAI